MYKKKKKNVGKYFVKIVIRGQPSVCHVEVFLLQSAPVRLSANSLKPRAPPTKVTLLSSAGRCSVAFTPKRSETCSPVVHDAIGAAVAGLYQAGRRIITAIARWPGMRIHPALSRLEGAERKWDISGQNALLHPSTSISAKIASHRPSASTSELVLLSNLTQFATSQFMLDFVPGAMSR